MTAAYLDARRVDVLLSGVWTNISSDIVSNIKAKWGISGNGPNDRTATIGELTFTVNNAGQRYSLGAGTALAGLQKGCAVRVVLTFDGAEYIRFRGYIESITPQSGTWGTRRAQVRCNDWMDIASTYPILTPQAAANQRMDQAVTTIVDAMPIQPQARQFAAGNDIFSLVFDIIPTKSRALSEFAKLVLSEYGYLYLKKGKLNGEVLTVEARHDRDSGILQSSIPVSAADAGRLLMEDGNYLLLEDGGKIILDELTIYDYDLTMQSLESVYGDNFSNFVTLRNYPRLLVQTVSVLVKLNSPISLAAGQTKSNIRGSFIDPTAGGTRINGDSMLSPVLTTDYQMFQNQNGTGTDLTANLSVTAQYTSEGVLWSVTNTGGTAGYVTKLQARGYPVYIYNPIEQFAQDDPSILLNGYRELVIDQRYSPSLQPNNGLAQIVLAQEKDARLVVNKINLLANTSYEHMASFLSHDVGSLIHVVEAQTAVSGFYFIQSVEYDISLGGIIRHSYGLKEAASLSDTYWTLETAGKGELDQTTYVSY